VVDHHKARIELVFQRDGHRAKRALALVAVGCVDHHRHRQLFGEFELRTIILVLESGLFVIAELADGDHALFEGVARQDFQHRLGKLLIVGLFGIQTNGAVVAEAKLAGAKALEAADQREIVDVATDIGAWLAEPEGGLDASNNSSGSHALIVIGSARNHVRVGIQEHGRLTPVEP
jgi:hypothetical protein